MRASTMAGVVIASVGLTACSRAHVPSTAPVVTESTYRPRTPLGLDEFFEVPDSNALTRSKVALGQQLFFDARLSRDSSVACASCHRPDLAFADTVKRSRGASGRSPSRNTPSLVNRAWARSFFRDGRTTTLETTVLKPVSNPVEMDLPLDRMVSWIEDDDAYRTTFARIFPDAVTETNVARSLASYVRVLRSGDSPYDRFTAGDTLAISAEARSGFRLFNGRLPCSRCHAGPLLSDGEFHNTGIAWGSEDQGRFGVTGESVDRGQFRTPSLRDVAITPPYMHDGSKATLEDVIDFYEKGGGPNPHLDHEIRPLRLSADEKRSLVAFLESLTGAR